MHLVRYGVVMLVIALAVPGAAAGLASGETSHQQIVRAEGAAAGTSSRQAVRAVAGAPAAFSVSGIQFALEKGDNAQPINPDTRFEYGTRGVWAFWSWSDAKAGSRVNWVLRFGGSDVNWGTISTDRNDGRMEVLLERQDGQRLDIGIYRLHLDAAGGDSGNVLAAEFEIFDPDVDQDDDGDDNDNDGDDGDNDNDDEDDDNEDDDNEDEDDNENLNDND